MRYISIFIALTALTISSCKKKDTSNNHFISAKIESFTFYASGNFLKVSKNVTAPTLVIEGLMTQGNTLKLNINSFTGVPGTYQLDGSDGTASYLPETPSIEVASVHGTYTISSVTPDITGTFNFTCTDSTVVIGAFSIAPL